ncbi:MAG: VWA domain-containing protein [Anaerolineales bacterium]|nr:VWA domain-containing protein [Chloroflexota bacterium]MBL6980743.1 VWA domain-containing protein [Anaerolineales bacterium]
MQDKTDFYERLGVPVNATAEEIHRAYREAARRFHPDVNIGAGATELFLDVKEAYEILITPESRASYDKDDQPIKKNTQPVRIDIQYSRTAIHHSKEQQLLYTLLDIDILPDPTHVDDSAPPVNISLILDTSTSMRGARLDVLKATAIEFVRNLRIQDTVSIISFNDNADIVFPAGSQTSARKAEGRIHALHASGGTEILKGLQAGYNEVLCNYRPSNTNHIILITDGHTYGDEIACQKLADDAATKDIGLSSLGIGGKWNDVLLDDLATRTGGDCLYVHKPKDIGKMLTKKLTRLHKAYAERLCLEFECGQNISLDYAFRLKPEAGVLPIDSPFKLGSLSKSGQQHILLEFVVDPILPGVKKVLLINGKLSFNLPSSSASYQIPIVLTRAVQPQEDQLKPPGHISKALSKLTLYRMQEQANKDIAEGDFIEASTRLKNVATHLLSQGESDLAQTVLAEAEQIKSSQNLSEEGKKRIKYGTRSLLLPAGNE